MSKTSKSEIEMLNAIKKQEERLKQMKSKFAKIKTAERAKTNANIIKALEYANDVGVFGGVTQPWDMLADWLIRQADKYVQKQQQQQGPAV